MGRYIIEDLSACQAQVTIGVEDFKTKQKAINHLKGIVIPNDIAHCLSSHYAVTKDGKKVYEYNADNKRFFTAKNLKRAIRYRMRCLEEQLTSWGWMNSHFVDDIKDLNAILEDITINHKTVERYTPEEDIFL